MGMLMVINFNGPVILDTDDYSAVMQMLRLVDENGYGSSATYTLRDENISVNVIKESQLKISEESLIPVLKQEINKLNERNSGHWNEKYKLQEELKTLKIELATYKQACPHIVPINGDKE